MMITGPITANTTPAVDKRADIFSYFFLPAVSPLILASEACSGVVINIDNGYKMNKYKYRLSAKLAQTIYLSYYWLPAVHKISSVHSIVYRIYKK